MRSSAAGLLLLVLAAAAQDTGIESARLSPTLYFSSASEEAESRQALHSRVETLEKEIASSSADALPKLLDSANQALIAIQRHTAYVRIETLEDTTDQGAKAALQAVETDWSVLNAAMRKRLQQAAPSEFPSLGRFARLAQKAHEDSTHTLSPEAAAYRGSVTVAAQTAIADAYDRMLRGISNQGVSSRDADTRRAALTRRDEAYEKGAPATAAQLAVLIDIVDRDAVARGYANAADRAYRSLQITDAMVRQTLAAVEEEAPVYKHYQEMLAKHAARKLGVSTVLPAEVDLARTPAPRMGLDQARRLVLDALKPLGDDYEQRFAQLLDPAKGRLDLTGGKHRARTGTSIVVYDAPVAFFYTGFNGTLSAAGIIAHEGGHAIHQELMNAGGSPIYERSGPHSLFEGFAIFNELLVLNHAAEAAGTPAERASALEQLLGSISFELFGSAEETAFERGLYTRASGHAMLDRAEIDGIFREAVAPYEYWPVEQAANSGAWMRKRLLFEDPLYLVNYLYAQLVAVALFDKLSTDRGFPARYEAVLRRGFDADAGELLSSLGIRLEDPQLVRAAARLVRTRTEELEKLYQIAAGAK